MLVTEARLSRNSLALVSVVKTIVLLTHINRHECTDILPTHLSKFLGEIVSERRRDILYRCATPEFEVAMEKDIRPPP